MESVSLTMKKHTKYKGGQYGWGESEKTAWDETRTTFTEPMILR